MFAKGGGSLLCGKYVALHFAERDGRLRQAAVAMKNGVEGILPSLLNKSFFGALMVFVEAVAIEIRILVDPVESRFDVWPNVFDECQIVGSLEVSAGQHQKERGGIHAAVIAAEWHFARRCHFSVTNFVNDLTGFGVAAWTLISRLCFCQVSQNAASHSRCDPKAL